VFGHTASRLLGLALVFVGPAGAQALPETQVRAAAARSIGLLEKITAQWKGDCFSCHHQALPMIAFDAARQHGLPVNEEVAGKNAAATFAVLSSIDEAVQDSYIIDPALSEGHVLLAADAAGIAPSLTTAIYARRLASVQKADGHWDTFDGRPPESISIFTATAICSRVIGRYMPPALAESRRAVLERAREWLLANRPASTEDAAFRLLGLGWLSASANDRNKAASDLLLSQKKDGGWAQLPELASDAYSTGEAIAALIEAGGIARADPRVQRGLKYLVDTQRSDGSWLVETRLYSPAPISPPYFESGFPYGRSQFISCAGTSWAIRALADSLPPAAHPVKPLPVTVATPKGAEPWMETVLFGSARELEAKLQQGLNLKSTAPEGTSLLMMAAGDLEKVKLLLDRGADPLWRAKSGFDALMAATLYRGNASVVRLLLEKGANANPPKGTRFNGSPLVLASNVGDVDVVEALLARGANTKRPMLFLGTFSNTSFFVAATFPHLDVMRVLVRYGANVDEADRDKMTPLSWAALSHKDDAVKLLLELGADPNHVDRFGYTPLRHADDIRNSSPETTSLLRPVTKVGAGAGGN
jgi:ankyrin repeat protein